MIEKIDLNFTIWLSSFDVLESFFILLSLKHFSLFLVILFAIYMIRLERLKTFAFIFLATCFGDMTGNFLKNLLAQPRPCFEHSDYLISSGVISGSGLAQAKIMGFFAIFFTCSFFRAPFADNPRKTSASFIASSSVLSFVSFAYLDFH